MPMGYHSFIGDMGSSLSGGQKQRIILGRALYRCPAVLYIDEATSHLDVACEKQVSKAIGQLSLTRIIVAHRPETICSADRVLVLAGGVESARRCWPMTRLARAMPVPDRQCTSSPQGATEQSGKPCRYLSSGGRRMPLRNSSVGALPSRGSATRLPSVQVTWVP